MHYMPTKSQHFVNEMMSQILENAFVIFYLFVFLYFICISVNQKEFPFQQDNYKYCISISKYIKIFWCNFDIMKYQKYPYTPWIPYQNWKKQFIKYFVQALHLLQLAISLYAYLLINNANDRNGIQTETRHFYYTHAL